MQPNQTATAGTRWHDHVSAGRFRVDFWFAGQHAGGFQAVDGIQAQVELIEYRAGRDRFVRQIPGRPRVTPVVLRKGYVNTALLWDWMQATMDGKFTFANVSVVLLDDDGAAELARYNLVDCWPSRWSGWRLDADAGRAMVEELELQVRTMERVAGHD